ncbi:inorganic triphosphatase [Serratia symbiotica]|uniref:CYTH domain-containing protein n=1 Tax=Serratia symbiotica TaxID=138074 RepID=UPI001D92C3C0|nr:inorganic triphosphatase [Serratia symbiotica]NIG87867.1 inorganic triphosphatase [Serratia symbiotica]USS95372.1 inorganic triphosphatase [Serratia symbiotica]
MTVEIELKLIATPAAVTALPQQLVAWPNQHATPQKLTNIYFETADNFLRSQDMGLRICGFDDSYEMTLKTAGKVLVSLHQRPEYNVSIATPVLALEQFPAGIWPLGCDLTALQQALQALRTDFMREKWVVTYGTSEIEVSLDQGEISAAELREALCEIELELKQGHTADLLALANALAEHDGLRQGNLSKAARGYHLAQGNIAHERRQLRVLKPAAKSSVEQGMIASVELALSHWQYHEELWLGGDVQARRSVLEAIALIRQALLIFGGLVPRKASADLRARLTTLDDSFKRFCDIMLGRSAAELKAAFNHTLNYDEYPEQLPPLTRHLSAFTLLSGVYPDEQTEPYLASWRELQLALDERRQSGYEASRKQALSHAPFWLNSAL